MMMALHSGAGERIMGPSKLSLVALVLLSAIAAASGASAQDDRWRQDFKTLVPPVVPLPPNSQLTPGNVGGYQTPYTTAPLRQSPTQPSQPTAPGLRLSIPSSQ
jgi:hypothetical protein